ncbi:MAG: membrane protein insertion efficiency factor YidD [Rhodospirillales bacterium]|nr:membrane protein insertion efficiency factor YidD [Alphaproteobacteria bacterium]MCB9981512.1 membrane protein insertion efficiency factor YidD [Rhodospirillales bacterium]
MKRFLQALIKLYSATISPFLGRNCRFQPTCSAYAHEAIENHGTLKGLWLATHRILKCHPFYKGRAHDPVPPKSQNAD